MSGRSFERRSMRCVGALGWGCPARDYRGACVILLGTTLYRLFPVPHYAIFSNDLAVPRVPPGFASITFTCGYPDNIAVVA